MFLSRQYHCSKVWCVKRARLSETAQMLVVHSSCSAIDDWCGCWFHTAHVGGPLRRNRVARDGDRQEGRGERRQGESNVAMRSHRFLFPLSSALADGPADGTTEFCPPPFLKDSTVWRARTLEATWCVSSFVVHSEGIS